MTALELQWTKNAFSLVFTMSLSSSFLKTCLLFCHKTRATMQFYLMFLFVQTCLFSLWHYDFISKLQSNTWGFVMPILSLLIPCQVFCGRIRAQWAADRRSSQEEELQWGGGGFVQGGQGAWSGASGSQWERARRVRQSPCKLKTQKTNVVPFHSSSILSFIVVVFHWIFAVSPRPSLVEATG